MPPSEFVDILHRIRQLETDDANYQELLRQMHHLARLAPFSVGSIHAPGVRLYRNTTHHAATPQRIEDVWYPPASVVKGFGRANRPGNPVFYCCSDQGGAFLEAKATVGQYSTLATWETTARMIVHHVGYSDSVMSRAGADRAIEPIDRHAFEHLGPALAPIREFLSLAFTDPNVTHYRATAAIAEMFMAADGIAGIKYPSIAKDATVDNLALLPEFVHSGLTLIDAVVVRVHKVANGNIEGEVIARLESCKNGDLSWMSGNKERQTTFAPGTPAQVFLPRSECLRVKTAGTLQINDKVYDVLPGYSISLLGSDVVVTDLQNRRVLPKT